MKAKVKVFVSCLIFLAGSDSSSEVSKSFKVQFEKNYILFLSSFAHAELQISCAFHLSLASLYACVNVSNFAFIEWTGFPSVSDRLIWLNQLKKRNVICFPLRTSATKNIVFGTNQFLHARGIWGMRVNKSIKFLQLSSMNVGLEAPHYASKRCWKRLRTEWRLPPLQRTFSTTQAVLSTPC